MNFILVPIFLIIFAVIIWYAIKRKKHRDQEHLEEKVEKQEEGHADAEQEKLP